MVVPYGFALRLHAGLHILIQDNNKKIPPPCFRAVVFPGMFPESVHFLLLLPVSERTAGPLTSTPNLRPACFSAPSPQTAASSHFFPGIAGILDCVQYVSVPICATAVIFFFFAGICFFVFLSLHCGSTVVLSPPPAPLPVGLFWN